MPQFPDIAPILRARYVPLLVSSALALAILAGTIFCAALYVRSNSRRQIIGRDAEILNQLWLSKKFGGEGEDILDLSETPSDQLFALLDMARLPQMADLLGTRLFDGKGVQRYGDANLSDATLSGEDLKQLRRRNEALAHFRPSVILSNVFVLPDPLAPTTAALLEVNIPIRGRARLAGAAQFILDGKNIALEFDKLDGTLMLQGTYTFLIGGGLLVLVLVLGFRKLEGSNRLLAERTQHLLRANQELALAAKTSAVGAVTAHLIHGLKNPLSGLQSFVAARGSGGDEVNDPDWQLALTSTRRMQTLMSEIVRVLRDEEADSEYELTLQEFSQLLNGRVQPLAGEAGVNFEMQVTGQSVLRNREVNLISLILYNLVHNAIQATPRGRWVGLELTGSAGGVVCKVRDQGPGIPEPQQAALFTPCRSTKEGGSGIGLAISKQLANCIGAELRLEQTGPSGSIFALCFGTTPTSSASPLTPEEVAR